MRRVALEIDECMDWLILKMILNYSKFFLEEWHYMEELVRENAAPKV